MPLKARSIDSELESLPKAKAAFIEPMLPLRTGVLPEAAEWLYELNLRVKEDGVGDHDRRCNRRSVSD
jgi:hypothetical protein